jgi:glutamate 5-kinase
MNTMGNGARNRDLGHVKRVIVKVGSGVIAAKGKLRPKAIEDLAYHVTLLVHQGYEVVMVVSGAVAAGYPSLGMAAAPKEVVERQAAACIGQYKLMTLFAKAFGKHRVEVAQVLLMADDIEDRRRFLSARHTLLRLVSHGIVTIINENDPLADDEAKIGDNDHLAALVTNLVSAQLLIILSSVPGLYAEGMTGPVIPKVSFGSSVEQHISAQMTATGVGGMMAKVSAARLAGNFGVPTIIADGKQPDLLPRILHGEEIGTMFVPRDGKLISSRKRWIAFRTRSAGTLHVDEGARQAIVTRGASLLPSGILEVDGRFELGARVDIKDATGKVFAVGLASYPAGDIRKMRGRKKSEFKDVLGYEYTGEIVNRDDMVVLERDLAVEIAP